MHSTRLWRRGMQSRFGKLVARANVPVTAPNQWCTARDQVYVCGHKCWAVFCCQWDPEEPWGTHWVNSSALTDRISGFSNANFQFLYRPYSFQRVRLELREIIQKLDRVAIAPFFHVNSRRAAIAHGMVWLLPVAAVASPDPQRSSNRRITLE